MADRLAAERQAARELEIAKQVQARLFPQRVSSPIRMELSSVLREWGGDIASLAGTDLAALTSPYESALAQKLAEFPEVMARAAAEFSLYGERVFKVLPINQRTRIR